MSKKKDIEEDYEIQQLMLYKQFQIEKVALFHFDGFCLECFEGGDDTCDNRQCEDFLR